MVYLQTNLVIVSTWGSSYVDAQRQQIQYLLSPLILCALFTVFSFTDFLYEVNL